jgi:hypothetical protein
MILCITISHIITYRLLGELGAAGLRAPPECVADPQPDLGNTSEGNASIAASVYYLSMQYPCDLTRSTLNSPSLCTLENEYVTWNHSD